MTPRIAKIDSWYDRHTRSWVIQKKDAEGNQIGAADYAGTKADRDAYIRDAEADRAAQERPPHREEDMLDEATGKVRLSIVKAMIRHRSAFASISIAASVRWYRLRLSAMILAWRYRHGIDVGFTEVSAEDFRSMATEGRLPRC